MNNFTLLRSLRSNLKELTPILLLSILVAFIISSLYISTEFLAHGMPWSDSAWNHFSLSSVKKIPITDVAENISSAVFIHNNLTVYEDFIINHFPGIPFLLSGFAKLFGFRSIVGGPETFYAFFYFSFFVSAFIQLFLINLACRVYLGMSFINLMVLSAVYGFYYLYYANFILPLSEMLIIPFVFIAAVQIFLYVHDRLRITNQEIMVAIFVLVCANYLGLTALPFFILYGLIIGFAYFFHSQSKKIQPDNGLLIIPLGIMTCYFLSTLYWLDVSQMFYWNFDFNVTHSSFDYIARINSYLNYVISDVRFFKFGQTAPIFAETNFYTLLAVAVAIYFTRPSLKLVMLFIFLVASMHWRVIEGFKIYPLLGIVLAFLLTHKKLIVLTSQEWTLPKFLFPTILFLSIGALFAMASLKFTTNYKSRINEDYQACTMHGDKKYCSCLIQDFWQPDYFLKNNVLPCQHQFPSYPGLAGLTLGTKLELYFAQHNFLLRQQDPRLVDDLPENIKDYYSTIDCEPFDHQSNLCVIKNLSK